MIDDERQLERLVDGELTADEQRQLLLRLDDYPQLWRRLALRFLEERELRSVLGGLVVPAPPESPGLAVTRPVRATRRRAIAAGVLTAACAFCLGFFLQTPTELPGPGGVSVSTDAGLPAASKMTEPEPKGDPIETAEIEGGPTEYIAMKLVGNDNVALQEVSVPVISPTQATFANSDAKYEPMVSPEVRAAFLRQGRTVSEQVELIPIRLEDGREAVLPITNIRVRPLRNDEVF